MKRSKKNNTAEKKDVVQVPTKAVAKPVVQEVEVDEEEVDEEEVDEEEVDEEEVDEEEVDEEEVENSLDVEVLIDPAAYQELMFYVNSSDFEVSGFGSVDVEKDPDSGNTVFRVRKIFLLDQENTPVHTEIDPVAIGKLEYEFHKAGIPEGPRWWWHSHVDMDVFWSGEDLATIRKLSAPGWFVATVFNKKEEMRSAFAQGGLIPLMVDDIFTSVRETDEDLVRQWEENYDNKVKNVRPSYGNGVRSAYSPGQGSFPGMHADDHWWTRSGDDEDGDETVEGIADSKSTEVALELETSIYNFALECGLGIEQAEEYCQTAERLLEDGRYSASKIEEAVSGMMMRKAIIKEGDEA